MVGLRTAVHKDYFRVVNSRDFSFFSKAKNHRYENSKIHIESVYVNSQHFLVEADAAERAIEASPVWIDGRRLQVLKKFNRVVGNRN
ncbi:PREDICTED: uncharacterized protein LOC104787568 isoform X2 [Camelina sativa]|uniref:Uncharacterized protein LOC104787568 isoform X2 n=1 Tax=Camelina sativa TaxID=90675 RepID=A0ABM1RRD2_CAMSA|nr:PREDICTED: uncharacterized protein LOC104787568 isoform X2 [Camelina sativa]XP_019101570.1 PREDICTED: uncharacterized protein LOC104787568 isoform X2 [Camelina sativa]